MAQNSIPILNNNHDKPDNNSTSDEELFKAEKAQAAEEGKANALLLVNTLRQLADKQNELSRKIESLEQEISHLKMKGGQIPQV
jgi:uncharacterized protein YlxW (UPF0749 family)